MLRCGAAASRGPHVSSCTGLLSTLPGWYQKGWRLGHPDPTRGACWQPAACTGLSFLVRLPQPWKLVLIPIAVIPRLLAPSGFPNMRFFCSPFNPLTLVMRISASAPPFCFWAGHVPRAEGLSGTVWFPLQRQTNFDQPKKQMVVEICVVHFAHSECLCGWCLVYCLWQRVSGAQLPVVQRETLANASPLVNTQPS